jgi:hypothetical protein
MGLIFILKLKKRTNNNFREKNICCGFISTQYRG